VGVGPCCSMVIGPTHLGPTPMWRAPGCALCRLNRQTLERGAVELDLDSVHAREFSAALDSGIGRHRTHGDHGPTVSKIYTEWDFELRTRPRQGVGPCCSIGSL
jgi:hypothetical protein